MGEVVATKKLTLSDSTYSTRPNTISMYRSDANAGGDDLSRWKEKQMRKHMRVPKTVWRQENDSFVQCGHANPENPSFSKYNPDQGPWRAVPPGRVLEPVFLDPTSGFMSASGDINRNTGHTRILNYRGIPSKPNNMFPPHERHTIRKGCKAVYPELNRSSEDEPGSSQPWSSRKVQDVVVRAKLGGWTSDVDPRKLKEGKKSQNDEAREIKEKLANKFRYTSSTQSAFEDVMWDNMLPPRLWPPVQTYEKYGPDPIRSADLAALQSKRDDWQALGQSWDRFQSREGTYKSHPLDVNFTSEAPRASQIPGYTGCIGGENIHEISDMKYEFHPFTIKRSDIPGHAPTSWRPHIPGYTGVTFYHSEYNPQSHESKIFQVTNPRNITTTSGSTHRTYPADPLAPKHTKEAPFTRGVSNVHPHNPWSIQKAPKEQYTMPVV